MPPTFYVSTVDISRVRKRFTLAHEFGHLMLHDDLLFRDNAAFSGDPREVEANRFAANLLMPLWMLSPLVTSGRRSAADLARMFVVSPEAMGYQLARLL